MRYNFAFKKKLKKSPIFNYSCQSNHTASKACTSVPSCFWIIVPSKSKVIFIFVNYKSSAYNRQFAWKLNIVAKKFKLCIILSLGYNYIPQISNMFFRRIRCSVLLLERIIVSSGSLTTSTQISKFVNMKAMLSRLQTLHTCFYACYLATLSQLYGSSYARICLALQNTYSKQLWSIVYGFLYLITYFA